MTFRDWWTTTSGSFIASLQQLGNYLPHIIWSLVALLIGVLVAYILKWVIQRLIEVTRLQSAFDQLDFAKSLRAANMKVDLSTLVGEFVRWVVIILTLLQIAASPSMLDLPQVNNMLTNFLGYLPSIASIVFILFLGILFAEFLGNIVQAIAAGLGARSAIALGSLTRNILYITVGLFALSQLIVGLFTLLSQLVNNPGVINILLTGLVAAAAVALGLAFGLGGRDAASDLITHIRGVFSK